MKYPEVRIIYNCRQPDYIRDRGGLLFTFRDVSRYQGQEDRYTRELLELNEMADQLLLCLQTVTGYRDE